MEDDEKKDGEKSEANVQKEKTDGDRTSDAKDPGDQDREPSPQQEGSSIASEKLFPEGKLDDSKHNDDDEYEDDVKLRILRCLTSSFLAGARCSLHCKNFKLKYNY